jgi:hypothetical protein
MAVVSHDEWLRRTSFISQKAELVGQRLRKWAVFHKN